MFTSNLNGFKRLLKEGTNGIQIEDCFDNNEKHIINNFLRWENSEKDKAIFDLANYSLEYCMLTNSKNTEFSLQNLKHKDFYLDTNILYRAIGLNGEELKERTCLFLSKFKDVNENLFISYNTKCEFKDTINYYIGKLENRIKPRVNSKLLCEFLDINSVYRFYHQWCIGRTNNSIEYFRIYLFSEYDNICKKYNLVQDYKFPYKEEEISEELNNYISGIIRYSADKTNLSAGYDAKNIMWVEKKRMYRCSDIFDTKSFFLSSDKTLYNWDYTRKTGHMPIVMSPSQWLNIILHYLERTEDDYRSFVCFLSMKTNNPILSSEQTISIVSGISEITSDIGTQRNLVKNFIELEVNDDILNLSEEELENKSKQYAESELNTKIKDLERKDTVNKNIIAESNNKIGHQDKTIKELSIRVSNMEKNIADTSISSAKKDKTIDKLKIKELRSWKILKILFFSIIAVFMLILIYFSFFKRNWEYNYVGKLVVFFDKHKDSSVFSIGQAIVLFPLSCIVYCVKMIVDASKVTTNQKRNFWTKSSKL